MTTDYGITPEQEQALDEAVPGWRDMSTDELARRVKEAKYGLTHKEAQALDDEIPGWREMSLEEFVAAKQKWTDDILDLMNALKGKS